MKSLFKYATIRYEGAKVGDAVRFVNPSEPGKPGAVMKPKAKHEINAVLHKVNGTMAYVEVKSQLGQATPRTSVSSGGASEIRVELPMVVGGTLRIE